MISPLLANVYLHYVLDEWFAAAGATAPARTEHAGALLRRLRDAVCVTKTTRSACWKCSAKRLGKYGLQLHPDKTQLVDFRLGSRRTHGEEAALATTFNFLGFTHVWGRSRKGQAVVRQQTAKDRFARALRAIDQQCRQMRHWLVREQHQRLCQMLRGHFAYFGITGNFQRLKMLHCAVGAAGVSGCRAGRTTALCPGSSSSGSWRYVPLPRPRIVHRYA